MTTTGIVLNKAEVRKQRAAVEKEIAACQSTISEFVAWRDKAGQEFHAKATLAVAATQRKDELIDRIAREGLWAYDYDSAEDYYDQHGLSRQRVHQVKLEVTWKKLVNGYDPALPAPTGHNARHLGATQPKKAIEAYRRAVKESNGKQPAYQKTKELVAAAKAGVKMSDDGAVARWRDRQRIEVIMKNFKALSKGGQDEVRRLIAEHHKA